MQNFTKSIKFTGLIIFILAMGHGCGEKRANSQFVATSAPISMILEELTGGKTAPLAPAGASPHTYSPSPSDEARASEALALFYVADNSDGWADQITAKQKIKLIDLLPNGFKLEYGNEADAHEGEAHGVEIGGVDPHFWMDPLAVKALLPALSAKLIELVPAQSQEINKRAAEFARRLDEINAEVASLLAPVKGSFVYTYHPSMRYFLKRYGLNYAGSIELSPGKEASPTYIAELTNKIKASGTPTIFTEPQFPRKPAETISEAAGVKLMELDPIGGSVKSYRELILHNARLLANGLKK